MIVKAISKVINGINLSEAEMQEVMEDIMSGKSMPSQIASFITALRMKGETTEEITAAAKVMRKKVTPVDPAIDCSTVFIDTCGTGGDKSGTFNISTVAAFVIAGAGVKVAKHGNRSATSKCGSADLIKELGITIDLPLDKSAECIEKTGFGFLYAPLFHSAMKYVADVRKEIGIRTIFNMLGPLTNPAKAPAQLIGVYAPELTDTFAYVLRNLGCDHALIVHGSDGLDEITVTGKTKIVELKGTEITTYSIHPEDFGIRVASFDDMRGGSAKENGLIAKKVLSGSKGAKRDVVLLNSAAGLIAAGKAADFIQGIEIAAQSIDSGKAMAVLQELIQLTNKRSR
jgi:anthranilate phosphoribosyltransferase